MEENLFNKMRQDCWDKALDSFAYSYIYSKRIESADFWLRWSKVLGIIVPVLLGGVVSSYYSNQTVMYWALLITTPIAIAQLVISTYLTVVGSDEKVKLYQSKSVEYSLLNSEIEHLAKYPSLNFNEYSKKYEILLERERGISRENQNIKDKELRMGMRYGLRNYRRECAGCGKVPVSMKSTHCDVCGKF